MPGNCSSNKVMANSHPGLSGSQPGRPSPQRRYFSKTSEQSQSLSEGSSSQRTGAHRPQRHVVGGGHGRLGARNTSIGKNLNKLTKVTAAAHDGPQAPKIHATPRFGDTSLPSSPRSAQAVKRHSSAFPMPGNTSLSALKKNHSSGHLPKHGSSKNVTKTVRGHSRRAHSQQSDNGQQSQPTSPAQPMVRFDLGDEQTQPPGEEELTEASASRSPRMSRSNIRLNSITDDDGGDDGYVNVSAGAGSRGVQIPGEEKEILISQSFSSFTSSTAERLVLTNCRPRETELHVPTLIRLSPTPQTRDLPDRTRDIIQQMNGSSPYHQFRPPDADAITSRILQKHNAAPQVSAVSAVTARAAAAAAAADPQHPASLSHSQGSTLADGTPGRDLISRFINGSGGSAGGTPAEDSYLGLRQRRDEAARQDDQNELESGKRNKSAPSMSKAVDQRRTVSTHSVSGRSTPTELPPSRTAQKLLLQRASSAIEQGKHLPAVLPNRPGAPQLLGAAISFGESGPMPAQIQGLFNQTNKEYEVVHRFRNPLAESISRLGETSIPRQQYISRPKDNKATPNNSGDSKTFRERDATLHRHHAPALSQGGHASTRNNEEEQGRTQTHRARVSFDLPLRPGHQDTEGVDEEEQMDSFADVNSRARDDPAYELCRQMWELDYGGDVGGADAG